MDLTNAVAVSAGGDFSLALKSDGTVAAWGNNDIGQCNVPEGLINVIAISAGLGGFAFALKGDGTVVGWGNNKQGQLNVPLGLSNVTAIAAGWGHTLALKQDGTVVAWGYNDNGGTNVPAGLSNVVAITAYDNSIALKADGTIVAWGPDGLGANDAPPGLPPVAAIATKQHTLALLQGGTLAGWGLNDYGAATVPPSISNVIAIAVGGAHDVILESDGTVVAWGFNRDGEGSVPPGLVHVSAISAGYIHNLAITTVPLITIVAQPQSVLTNVGATVSFAVVATCQVPLTYQWQKNGTNLPGATNTTLVQPNTQLSDAGVYGAIVSHPTSSVTSTTATLSFTAPSITSQPKNVLVTAGNPASFYVAAAGSLPLSYQWQKNGTNLLGQSATNFVISSVQAADAGSYTVVVTNSSGSVTSNPAILSLISPPFTVSQPSTVVSLGGPPIPGGTPMPDRLNDVIAIAAGYGQQLAVHSNGTVAAWGGIVTGGSPQPPAGLSNVVAVSSAAIHSIALKSDGTVVGWGAYSTPPTNLVGVVAIASGHDDSLALKADGTTAFWGGVAIGTPPGNSNYVAVAAGPNFNTGVRSDGTVPPWNSYGFPGASNVVGVAASGGNDGLVMLMNDGTVRGWNVTVPAGLSNVVAVSAGLALKSDGTIVALGGATAPVGLTNVTAISGSVGNGLVLTRWPAILQPPQSQAVNAGTTAVFTVTAAGAPPLAYQWRKNGNSLNGATGTSLSISNAQPADAGTYDVLVGNGAGSILSQPATLTINAFPAVTISPKSATLFLGMRQDITGTATGAQPLAYKWVHNGTNIAGASSATLSLLILQAKDGGNYTLVVSNSYGSVTSAPTSLTIVSNQFRLGTPGTVVGLGGMAVPDGLTNVIAIAAGFGQQLAVRNNGTVVAWGNTIFGSPQPPPDLSNVVAVASGGIHSIALKSDGTVVGWGAYATPPSDLFGVVAIASGHDDSLALKADGTTAFWGGIAIGPPPGNSNYVAVAAGLNFNTGIRSDGTVPPWSSYGFPGASNVMGIAASGGFDGLVMLMNDGTVQGWKVSVPAGLSNVVAVSAGLSLKSDGTVVALGGATAPVGLTNVTAISGSVGNGLVLTTNPPPPLLAASASVGTLNLSTPVSVPGYVLEASDNLSGPFTVLDTYTNATMTNALTFPATGAKQYYRLRKR